MSLQAAHLGLKTASLKSGVYGILWDLLTIRKNIEYHQTYPLNARIVGMDILCDHYYPGFQCSF